MTNYKSAQCGIYELPKRIIELQTGCSRDTVDKLLLKFQNCNKIQYCEDTNEIMLMNWVKYNQPNNTNAIKCINKELKTIKNKQFCIDFYSECEKYDFDMESIFKDIEIQAPSKGAASKEVISNKEEIINNKQEIISNKEEAEVIACFESNMYKPKNSDQRKLHMWCTTIGCDMVIMAIEKAADYNVKNMNYIDKILNNWIKNGIKDGTKTPGHTLKKKISGWDFKNQRKYDFKELERKLLGWQ